MRPATDRRFLELEQADDGALMHIGGALLFGPVVGGWVAGVGLLLDAEPEPRGPSAPRLPAGVASIETWHGRPPHPPAAVGLVADADLAVARGGAHALMHPREAWERSRAVFDLVVHEELIAAPSSSLNVPLGTMPGPRPTRGAAMS